MAILNGPVANAFVAVHSPQKGIRISVLKRIPLPSETEGVSELVAEYMGMLARPELFTNQDDRLLNVLHKIDAAILAGYDLPPRLERQLLEFFRHAPRPVRHPWRDWFPTDFKPFIPLHEFVSEEFHKTTQPWVQKVFQPLPPEEAEILKYMD
jgi:hypothetical protein